MKKCAPWYLDFFPFSLSPLTGPGNILDGWFLLRGPTTHQFSQGLRNIYVYKCVENFDRNTLEMMEDLRDEEEEEQKKLRDIAEDAQ